MSSSRRPRFTARSAAPEQIGARKGDAPAHARGGPGAASPTTNGPGGRGAPSEAAGRQSAGGRSRPMRQDCGREHVLEAVALEAGSADAATPSVGLADDRTLG